MENIFEDNVLDENNDLEVILDQPNSPQRPTEDLAKDNDGDAQIVKPKKRVTRPRLKLDATRLVGPRGIGVLESTFKDFKFKGKGHELEDLNKVMTVLEHWAHRLYPKLTFQDCIDKIEDLGFKKSVMVHVTKIRLGMEEDEVVNRDTIQEEEVVVDPFDELVSSAPKPSQLTEEQKARILRNRLIAEEIRMKKMKAKQDALKAAEEAKALANKGVSNLPETHNNSALHTADILDDGPSLISDLENTELDARLAPDPPPSLKSVSPGNSSILLNKSLTINTALSVDFEQQITYAPSLEIADESLPNTVKGKIPDDFNSEQMIMNDF